MNSATGQIALQGCAYKDSAPSKERNCTEMTTSLSISRPSVIALQVEWLQTGFPVTQELLGIKHFKALSQSFATLNGKLNLQPDELVTQFADFVETKTNADTPPFIQAMAKLESRLANLPYPTAPHRGIEFWLKQLFRSQRNFRFTLSDNVTLYHSKHGEVEIWLANQPYYQANRSLHGVIGQYWVIERNKTGLSVSPVSQYHFEFYAQLKRGCSLAQLTPNYSEPTIRELLLCLMHGGMAQVVD